MLIGNACEHDFYETPQLNEMDMKYLNTFIINIPNKQTIKCLVQRKTVLFTRFLADFKGDNFPKSPFPCEHGYNRPTHV